MTSHGARRIAGVVFVFVFLTLALSAQNTATITGKVTTPNGEPITDAIVTLLELRRSVSAGADGTFRFDAVPPGHYHITAESKRYGTAIGEAAVAAGASRVVEVIIDPAVHFEEIVVSAGPDARRSAEVYQPVNVVSRDEVSEQLQPSLGETLNQEAGVTSTYFGPGSSRPIIRGLGGDRIRILEEGVGTGDASNVSPDHAVSVDPSKAQQIEIVRGPAALLYGSNAVGGLVNVIDDRVPSRVPAQAVTGDVDLRYGSVAGERSISTTLEGGHGTLAWHLDLLDRDTGDYEIPAPPDEFDDPAEFDGKLENSSLEARSGTLGASYVGSRGFIGLAFNAFETNYGVPGHAHHDEARGPRVLQEEEAERVRIDLQQRRLDLKGELTELGIFRNLRLRIGKNDYEHVELEGDVVGTRFLNNRLESRLEARHGTIGRMNGVLGVQYADNDFEAIGEEAFVPPNSTQTHALFAYEEVTSERWDLQFGARYESQDHSVADADVPDRSFAGISTSLGTVFRPMEGYAVAVSLARTVRIPTAQELYANGPHIATRQFEVGDPMLDEETSLGIDVSFRKTAGRVHGEVNLFQNRFDGYIFETPTGAEEVELPVFQFVQADARFRGLELETHTELWHAGESHLELEIGGDLVRASLSGGANLPRIPPARYSAGLRYRSGQFSASLEAWRYARQSRVADLEEPTDGYTLVNAAVSYRLFTGNLVHDILLRGTNLTDELARSHVSPLKETVPLPGRDFTIAYRLAF